MPRFFLDTSAHIERNWGRADARDRLSGLLSNDRHATSTHVQREWKGIVEASTVAILNEVREARDRPDLVARLKRGFGRTPVHRWMVFEAIVGSASDLGEIELRAQTFLRSRSIALFMAGLDEVRDGSECQLAREQAKQTRRGDWELKTQCRKHECQCRQEHFLAAQANRVGLAATALTQSSRSDDRKMGRAAQQNMASGDPLDRKGKKCWGKGGLGGDISIALECRSDETVLTSDSSFDLIAPAVGVQHHRFTT